MVRVSKRGERAKRLAGVIVWVGNTPLRVEMAN
jgi:hypothetical protein